MFSSCAGSFSELVGLMACPGNTAPSQSNVCTAALWHRAGQGSLWVYVSSAHIVLASSTVLVLVPCAPVVNSLGQERPTSDDRQQQTQNGPEKQVAEGPESLGPGSGHRSFHLQTPVGVVFLPLRDCP